MPTSFFPASMQVSALHEEMLLMTKHRLQQLAWNQSTLHGKKNYEFVVACFQVYSQWRDIIDILFSNHEWEKKHDDGIGPLAIASIIGWDICGAVAVRCPNVALEALTLPDEGFFKAFILAEDGVSVHHLLPQADLRQ